MKSCAPTAGAAAITCSQVAPVLCSGCFSEHLPVNRNGSAAHRHLLLPDEILGEVANVRGRPPAPGSRLVEAVHQRPSSCLARAGGAGPAPRSRRVHLEVTFIQHRLAGGVPKVTCGTPPTVHVGLSTVARVVPDVDRTSSTLRCVGRRAMARCITEYAW